MSRALAKPGVPRGPVDGTRGASRALGLTWRHGAALVLACASAFVGLDCSGAPKPCPLASEANYTAALVAACKDAGSVEACPAAPAIKAQHEAEQEDAGCRVK